MLNSSLSFRAGNRCEKYWLGLVNVSLSVMSFCCLSTNENVPAFRSCVLVFLSALVRLKATKWLEQPLVFWRITARGRRDLKERPDKGRNGNLSIHFPFLSRESVGVSFLPWVGEWWVAYCEDGIMHRHLLAYAFCLCSDSQDRKIGEKEAETETKISKREVDRLKCVGK